MPFVQRIIEPKYLSRTSLFDEDGTPLVNDNELIAVTNNTLSNALRQLASLVLVANDIFTELGDQFKDINKRSEQIKKKITVLEEKVARYDPKKVAVRKCRFTSSAFPQPSCKSNCPTFFYCMPTLNRFFCTFIKQLFQAADIKIKVFKKWNDINLLC